MRAEAIRRGLGSWQQVPPEDVDEVAYLLAESSGGLGDPLWCQTRLARKTRDLFYLPAWITIGLAGLAFVIALCLGALYAVVRVIRLAWR